MKKLLFLFAVALLFGSCNKFDQTKIKKLDNVYAHNNIMNCRVIMYNYVDGVLDSLNGKVIETSTYGLRGNLQYFQDKGENQFRNNSFKGTTMLESDVRKITDSSFVYKIKYGYKNNTTTDSYFGKDNQLEKKTVHHRDALDSDTLLEIYSKENKLIAKYTNIYDSIGFKLLKYIDLENPEFNYTKERISGNDKYKRSFAQKNAQDSISLEDHIAYDKLGRRTEYTRTIFGQEADIYTHFKYSYLTEDGLIDKLMFYNKESEPIYVHQYQYDKY